jgi:hypothetical protein
LYCVGYHQVGVGPTTGSYLCLLAGQGPPFEGLSRAMGGHSPLARVPMDHCLEPLYLV